MIRVLCIYAGLWLLTTTAMAQPNEYSALFERLQKGLFTVEVVDRVSNNKQGQGSGFVLDDKGLVVTNYHVVSEYIGDPEGYKLRYRDSGGATGALKVVDIDVLNDLALVRFKQGESPKMAASQVFELAASTPADGDTVLALGNPYDLGVSIVPGTYNGLMENRYRKNIHFTGALNPGMSGGPAVNTEGAVVGINVAGVGNSVSFLVPVARLRALIDRASTGQQSLQAMQDRAVQRIRDHQAAMVDKLLAGDWSLEAFGPLMIPREIRPWMSCSGNSKDADEDSPWQVSHSNCTVADRIYLSRSLDTGPLEIILSWYSSESLNAFRFTNVVENTTFMPFNRTAEDEVTEYECRERWTEFESLQPTPFKSSFCVRAYLDYPDLYDVLFVARAMLPGSEAVDIHYTMAGVARDTALRFHQHLLEALQWK